MLQYDAGTFEVGYVAKSFIIDHPKDSSKYLVHACIEGPENGLYYRGKAQLSEKISDNEYVSQIQLPTYLTGFARDYTVDVTPIYNKNYPNAKVIASEVNEDDFTFNIYSNAPIEVNWVVYAKHDDLLIEPQKSDISVYGEGPYTYYKRN